MLGRAARVLLLTLLMAGCADLVTNLPPYGSIEVDAVRRNGDPVPGAQLIVYTGPRPMGYATTGSDGTYLFDFLPKGQYGVYASPPDGYERPEAVTGGPTTAYIDHGLGLDEGEHKSATFTYLKVGPGSVIVRATRRSDGAPVAGVSAALYNAQAVVQRATTGDDGTVRFDSVPFGAWGVSMAPPVGYHEIGELGARWKDGLVVDDGSQDSVSMRFQSCEGKVRAVVRDAQGDPVPGYPLELYTAAGAVGDGITESTGVGVFDHVGCGEYGVRLGEMPPWLTQHGRGLDFADGLRVTRGARETVKFSVTRCVGSIRVLVQDDGGAPVEGASLVLYDAHSIVAQSTSDATGAHTFSELACVTGFGVRVHPPSGYAVAEGRGSSFFDGLWVTDGGVLPITFTLTSSATTSSWFR